MTDYVLVGGGAFARELYDWFTPGFTAQGHRFVGYLDDNDAPMAAYGRDLPQLGPINGGAIDANWRLVAALGSPKGKVAVVAALGAEHFETIIHPTAWVSASARLGRGCVIGPFTDVSADAHGGDFVTLNGYSSMGHNASMGDYSTLSGYVDLTGFAKVGERVFFGSGARVLPNVSVGDDCVIGAGAVIVRNAAAGSTYYAAPARKL